MGGELRFGAVADDYTGATDLAGSLARQGARTVQVLGRRSAQDVSRLCAGFDAAVVALKSRSEPVDKAVEDSVSVVRALRGAGCGQVYFKYCSTFDSTAAGNIGPVTDALMRELDVPFTIAAPAFPRNGRTQYLGHLFVGGQLLSESPMRHHPRTPMTDPNLVRHLQAQTRRRVGLLGHADVRQGAGAVARAADSLRGAGIEIALADALSDADLDGLAEAFLDAPLLTGGSALAERLAAQWQRRGLLGKTGQAGAPITWPAGPGPVLLLAGSCSARTLEQIDDYKRRGWPAFAVDVGACLPGQGDAHQAIDEQARLLSLLRAALSSAPAALVYSSMRPEEREPLLRQAAAAGLDGDALGARLEKLLAGLAQSLVASGLRKLVVAGGETSGAVVEALDVVALEIGAEIDPGVPRCRVVESAATGGPAPGLDLVLKSGNFGGVDFFARCLRALHPSSPGGEP